MSGLRLHPKYGLNATIPQCILCGKDKNEILLLGNSYKEEAPMRGGVLTPVPCEECKEKYLKEGIMLFCIENGNYKVIVIKEKAFVERFNSGLNTAILSTRIGRVTPEIMNELCGRG